MDLDETYYFTTETSVLVTWSNLRFHANIMESMLISQARCSKDTIRSWAQKMGCFLIMYIAMLCHSWHVWTAMIHGKLPSLLHLIRGYSVCTVLRLCGEGLLVNAVEVI